MEKKEQRRKIIEDFKERLIRENLLQDEEIIQILNSVNVSKFSEQSLVSYTLLRAIKKDNAPIQQSTRILITCYVNKMRQKIFGRDKDKKQA